MSPGELFLMSPTWTLRTVLVMRTLRDVTQENLRRCNPGELLLTYQVNFRWCPQESSRWCSSGELLVITPRWTFGDVFIKKFVKSAKIPRTVIDSVKYTMVVILKCYEIFKQEILFEITPGIYLINEDFLFQQNCGRWNYSVNSNKFSRAGDVPRWTVVDAPWWTVLDVSQVNRSWCPPDEGLVILDEI